MGETRSVQTRGLGVGLLALSLSLMPKPGIGEALRLSPGATDKKTVPLTLAAQPGKSSICLAQFSRAIETTMHHPSLLRSRWGVSIQTLTPEAGRSKILYERAAQQYFVPASTVKLLVTAAALHHFGPTFRIRTAIYGSFEGAPGDTLSDTDSDPEIMLRFRGEGDPSLTQTQLTHLAKQLRQQGIHQIGQLAVERDRFRGSAANPTWEWSDLHFPYAPRINSLILHQNATRVQFVPRRLHQPLQIIWSDPLVANQWQIRNQSIVVEPVPDPKTATRINIEQPPGASILTVKGQLPLGAAPVSANLAIPDPDLYFVKHLHQALTTEGIVADRIVLIARSDPQPNAQLQELAAVESPSLAQLILETNQNSNNLYAEVLLRQLGAVFEAAAVDPSLPDSATSTADRGLAAVKQILTALGVDANSYYPADASGLSRHNKVSPEALVQTL